MVQAPLLCTPPKREESQLTRSYFARSQMGQRSGERSKREGYDRRGFSVYRPTKKNTLVLASEILALLSWMTFCGSAVDSWLKMGSRYVVCEILETTHLAASSSLLWSRTELKTPGGACPVCLSLLPANAPVPSNTDKYCPNPELSLYNRDCIGDFCCE